MYLLMIIDNPTICVSVRGVRHSGVILVLILNDTAWTPKCIVVMWITVVALVGGLPYFVL